jgi:hypothetical protein
MSPGYTRSPVGAKNGRLYLSFSAIDSKGKTTQRTLASFSAAGALKPVGVSKQVLAVEREVGTRLVYAA